MKRYSIAPSLARRKSTANPSGSQSGLGESNDRLSATLELERLEQETTIVLQEIDKNLSDSNAIINDKIFPVIRQYSKSSESVWNNVGFWKRFFELAANTEIASYESPKVSNDLNTLANTQKNLLLLDDDEIYEGPEESKPHPGLGPLGTGNQGLLGPEGQQDGNEDVKFGNTVSKDLFFKKPLLRDNIEELTPTWSTEHPQKRMMASTPQLEKKPKRYNKFDSTDSLSINPPHMTSAGANSQPQSFQGETGGNRSPTRTYTIRQSLDNYHKLSISPKKNRYLKTPIRSNDDMRKRSSMIQDLINSSPTLPEPPILASEMEVHNPRSLQESGSNPNSNVNYDPPSELRNFERLSPITLNSGDRDDGNLQRFPRTPQFERMGLGSRGGLRRSSNRIKTPLEIRDEYHEDDSEIKPPTMSDPKVNAGFDNGEDDEEDVPFPDLETIDLKQKIEEFNRKKRKLDTESYATGQAESQTQEPADKDNVFLEDKSGNHSITSTIYHSIMNQHNRNPSNTNSNSKETTANQSKSISNLFEDVLLDLKGDKQPNEPPNEPSGSADNRPIARPVDRPENRSNDSTKEMGSMLEERFKQFIER